MRKVSALIILVLMLLVTACSGTQTKDQSAPAAPAPVKNYNINIATATTGGAYYPIGNSIANLWSNKIPGVKASGQATNGTPHNLQLMEKKEAEIGIAQSGVVFQAVTGTGAYKDTGKQTYFRGMTFLYPNVMHWIIRKDASIKGLADLKGKKFVPGPQNSATELNSREMLEIIGMDYRERKDLKADYLDYNQAAEQMKNRQTDAIMIAGGLPTAAVLDVMTAGEGRLLSLPEDYIKELTTKYPWYFPYSIPAGTYKGQDTEVKTVAVSNMLIARTDLPDDLVYTMLKVMYENQATLVEGHQAMKAFKLEDGLKGITGVVDLHPGAAKFFKEKGILK
jgi:hypothetical protein